MKRNVLKELNKFLKESIKTYIEIRQFVYY
jgi:hypothetical protein